MLAASALVVPASAQQGADDVRDPAALFREAEEAERAADPLRARGLYEQVIALAPRSRAAGRALVRTQTLTTEADGDWATYAHLLSLRAMPSVGLDVATLAKAAGTVAALPHSRPGREARIWLVDAWLQVGEPKRAYDDGQRALGTLPWSADERVRLLKLLGQAAERMGRADLAIPLLREAGDAGLVMREGLESAERRARIQRGARGALALGLLVMLGAVVHAGRRRRLRFGQPWLVVVGVAFGWVGAAIAALREEESVPAVWYWAAGVSVLIVLSNAAGAGAPRGEGAWGRAALAFAAALSVVAWTLVVGSWENAPFGWF